jgi:hypothetical protein
MAGNGRETKMNEAHDQEIIAHDPIVGVNKTQPAGHRRGGSTWWAAMMRG